MLKELKLRDNQILVIDSDGFEFYMPFRSSDGTVQTFINEYENRGLPVIPNLALLVTSCNVDEIGAEMIIPTRQELESIRDSIDQISPELNFGNKYYPCLFRHIKKFKFLNKYRVATTYIKVEGDEEEIDF